MSEERIVLETKHLTKEFPGVVAINNINVKFFAHHVHALVGENGAGKSTLMKVINGDFPQTSGKILLNGVEVEKMTPKKAQELGISFIRQELNLIPEMTVAENIFLGREIAFFGKLNWKLLYKNAEILLDEFHLDINPKEKIKDLSIAKQQIVEIAKALSLNANIIIMDEPTDVLTDVEMNILFSIIHRLKKNGKTIIYITHRLEELNKVCDTYIVLRDGKKVGEGIVGETDKKHIVDIMVGRDLREQFPRIEMPVGKRVLNVQNLSTKGILKNICFSANSGEILCFFGLVGSGRSELLKCLFGAEENYTGDIKINDCLVKMKSPKSAMAHGIFMISEDRKGEGIISEMSVKKNMTISSLAEFTSRLGVLKPKKENSVVYKKLKEFDIKSPSAETEIKYLSGGNQQKVLIAKGVITNPQVILFDEPTRGIDVGSKVAIYNHINELKKKGIAVIVVSSELPEVLGIADRIIVMSKGKISGEFNREDATEKIILNSAFT